MSQALLRLAVFVAWPLIGAFVIVFLAATFVMLWPALLLMPVRFEGGKVKVGSQP